jgi:hypothetical protein
VKRLVPPLDTFQTLRELQSQNRVCAWDPLSQIMDQPMQG